MESDRLSFFSSWPVLGLLALLHHFYGVTFSLEPGDESFLLLELRFEHLHCFHISVFSR